MTGNKDAPFHAQAPELLCDLFKQGTELLLDTMTKMWDGNGTLDSCPQIGEDATYAPLMSKAESLLDFSSLSAIECHNKVRAFAGWPGTRGEFVLVDTKEDKQEAMDIKILRTKVGDPLTPFEGDIGWGKDCMYVRCKGNSTLEIVELQCPNKRPVLIKDFRNGLRERTIELGANIKATL